MRTKHFILILCCVVITTTIFIVIGPAGEPNDSLKSIVTQTHKQLNKFQENLGVAEKNQLEIDGKYLAILGFTSYATLPTHVSVGGGNDASPKKQAASQADTIGISHLPLQSNSNSKNTIIYNGSTDGKSVATGNHIASNTPYNGTKTSFSIVTYVLEGQAAAAILLAQNVAAKYPNENLLIYDLGLSEDEARSLSGYCNSSKCALITYDLSVFPSYVADQRMHAYRPIVIKDALMRSKCILFIENDMRIRGTAHDLKTLQADVRVNGILGWATPTAVSTRTHPKMFDYFQTQVEDFIFLRMVDLDTVLFADTLFVTEKIMLPWIKCALTVECIDPIGAQSNGCKYNKKPQYRYSGCHGYDTSAFNIVLGLTWHWDDTKYSLKSDKDQIFYKETLEQATKILENRRRNETSEHPFTEE